ncbi:TetR/AcrR family transcriptional regulator [Telmatospirillum sp.]|uniref:TetR/AcrR family transcriptional regulator n=1 Tax=Telmatospirillum sp. TaxID=2079197 RepID=UPI0028406034|nr:TetR/AcrR family transcriptional regulator [Telmatospirillum sp.]MDR3436781.1 TetR/AcrR family transcriptional regulator [Telmatospirillum sp.]
MAEKDVLNCRSRRGESRRQQVLDAAAVCFRQSGFRGASMSDISALAGMSTGHIYHYFKSKEAIVEAIVARDLDQGLAYIEAAKANDDVLDGIIKQIGESVVDRKRMSESALSLEILSEAARNPTVAQTLVDCKVLVRQKLHEVFEIGQKQGSIAGDAPLDAVCTLLNTIYDGITVQSAVNPLFDREAIRTLLPVLVTFLLRGHA